MKFSDIPTPPGRNAAIPSDMVSRRFGSAAAAALCLVIGHSLPAHAQRASLAGRWTLNRTLSQFPREVGFGSDFVPAATTTASDRGATAGGSTGSVGFIPARQSQDDAKREALLVRLVKDPSPHLTITQTDAAVALTDDRGRTVTLHTDGKQESQALDDVFVTTITRWEADRLVVRYRLEQDRELRYTFTRSAEPAQLAIQVQLVERGGRDAITRIYDVAKPDEPPSRDWDIPAAPPKPAADAGPVNLRTELGQPLSSPAGPPQTAPVVASGPDGELKGLTALGVVVEGLSAQASACGLSQAPIDASVTKSFRDAGLTVRPDSDDDTYVYVRIITSASTSGICVSRYDVFLYTHTNGTLPYQTAPLLLQVQLLHKAGLIGGSGATHGDAVLKGVKQFADEIAQRIKAVNK
jgi:hypothetical protein